MHIFIESICKKAFINSAFCLISIAFAQPLFALEFECNSGTDRRFIRMELPGRQHLCEVSVTRANNQRKVMWYANNDSLFCSEKTEELRKKYESNWNFSCNKWPDHDGVAQLSGRQRNILDAELKTLINEGQNEQKPFMVEGLKAAASPDTEHENDVDLLVVQFFLHAPDTGLGRDVTHVIRDNGVSWSTQAKIDTLAKHIDADEGYVVNSALISSVTGNGALEIITILDPSESLNNDDIDTELTGCYGNQTMATSDNGELIARTPHRYYCSKTVAADAG